MLVTHGLIKSENDGCIISGEEYMEKIANKFADWLVCCGAPGDNREIYAYAVECLLNTVLIFSVIIVVSIILGKFLPTLLWILFFLPVRHTSWRASCPKSYWLFSFFRISRNRMYVSGTIACQYAERFFCGDMCEYCDYLCICSGHTFQSSSFGAKYPKNKKARPNYYSS